MVMRDESGSSIGARRAGVFIRVNVMMLRALAFLCRPIDYSDITSGFSVGTVIIITWAGDILSTPWHKTLGPGRQLRPVLMHRLT